jgi:hypothetical protein
MHRNTFRHRYNQAAEILGHSLDEPDVRLAVHVALKLLNVLPPAKAPAGSDASADGAAPRPVRRAPTGRRWAPASLP